MVGISALQWSESVLSNGWNEASPNGRNQGAQMFGPTWQADPVLGAVLKRGVYLLCMHGGVSWHAESGGVAYLLRLQYGTQSSESGLSQSSQ
jgi:hypothetical protein